MNAQIGDMLVIRGHCLGEPDRTGEIIAIRGKDGGPPYMVRWNDAPGHVRMVFPGTDAEVKHLARHRAAS